MKQFAYTTCKWLFYIWLGRHEKAFPSLSGSYQVNAENLNSRNCQCKKLPNIIVQAYSAVTFSSFPTVSDKDESCEEMSVPSSPQNEAIQHSSVSTSNGVSSSSATLAASAPSRGATTTSNQSTEESQPRRGTAQSQPSGSWLSWSAPECQYWSAVAPSVSLTNRGGGGVFSLSFNLGCNVLNLFLLFILDSFLFFFVWCIFVLRRQWNELKMQCFLWNWWRQKNRHFRCKM